MGKLVQYIYPYLNQSNKKSLNFFNTLRKYLKRYISADISETGRILLFDPRTISLPNQRPGESGGGRGLIRRGRYYVFKFRHNIVFISSEYKTVTVNQNVSLSNTDQMSSRSQSPVSSKVLRISSDIDVFLFSGFESHPIIQKRVYGTSYYCWGFENSPFCK